jgi:DNA-binding XRE family transcriptional regulator
MTIQMIKNNDELEWAVIPYKDYVELIEKAEMFDDIRDFDQIQNAILQGEEELFPGEVVDAILDGESPLKVIRLYRDLTQRELAERVGRSVPYLSQLETGKRAGSIKVLSEIARVLDVPLEMILVEDE